MYWWFTTYTRSESLLAHNLNVSAVPKCTGGLQPVLSLKQFGHYMCIPTFYDAYYQKVWQCIQQGDNPFFIDLEDAYLHVHIVKHHPHL